VRRAHGSCLTCILLSEVTLGRDNNGGSATLVTAPTSRDVDTSLKPRQINISTSLLTLRSASTASPCVHPINVTLFTYNNETDRHTEVTPFWTLMKQEMMASQQHQLNCKSFVPRSIQITMQAPHHSIFYRPDALSDAQPTVLKH